MHKSICSAVLKLMQILEYLKDLITLEPGQQPTGKLSKLEY